MIAAAVVPGQRLIVGIVGPPGAGKSTLAEDVVTRLAEEGAKTDARVGAALLPMDGFHLPQQRLVKLGSRARMGAPDTFDVAGFVSTLTALRSPSAFGNSGNAVSAPGFDRTIEEAVPGAIVIGPEFPIVVVEGNYLLLDSDGWGAVAPLLNMTIFVRLERGIRLARLIDRHVRFGKSPDAARAWALGPDETNARLIEGTSHRATHVVEL